MVMNCMNLSENGKRLIKLYTDMAENGYDREDGINVESKNTYNSFQLKKFQHVVLPSFKKLKIKTVLDYGGGGSNWDELNFNQQTGMSAKQLFEVRQVTTFEPARNKNIKLKSDCVVCIDVLEHVFLADVTTIVRELFFLAKKLLVINVACYKAAALLPTGENAHITIREPSWWLGLITAIASEFPEVEVLLICSETFTSGVIYDSFRSQDWHNTQKFTINDNFNRFGAERSKNSGSTPDTTITATQVLRYVDQLTKQYPQTGQDIKKVLEKNVPFLNSKLHE